MRRRSRTLCALVTAFALTPACTDPSAHVLVGNPFDPAGRCLQPSTGFDVVDGPEPGDCAPTCVIDARTGTTYVTATCPPYPPLDTTELADASTGAGDPCPIALAAWAAETVCGADAGPSDAGPSDAGSSGARDAARDAEEQ
jgi:hypothetical protein